jgi:MFS family permease
MSDVVAEPAAAAPRRFRLAALEVPTFRWYFATSWISHTGDGMENVIRNLLVLQLAGAAAPFWLGMMVFAHWVPFTFFSLYGGTLADRYDNRKVQLVAQLLLLAAALGVAVATLAGVVTVWWIFGLLLVHGFAGAIGGPAQQTLIHAMVGRDRLLSAVSLNSTSRQVSQVIGPAIAGFIYVVFGPGWGFLVNALTFVPLLVLLTLVRVRRLAQAPAQRTVDALREGVGFLRERPRLSALIAAEMLPVILLGHTFSSLVPLFARDQLGVEAIGYAFLLVASGAGALVAAAYLQAARERLDPLRFVIAAAAVEMVAILLFAVSSVYALSFVLMVVIGAAAVLAQSYTNTTLQLSAPDRLRGRVMGAYAFGTQGLRVINGPALGTAAQVLGAPLAVGGGAGLVLVGLGALALAVLPRARRS